MATDSADDEPLTRAPEALWRTTMRGVLVLVPDQEEPVLCTSPGDVVWELLAEPTRPSELARLLADHYDVDEATVAADLAPVLDELRSIGALVVTTPAEVDPEPTGEGG